MKHPSSHAFVNQLLVYTLAMICTSGSVGLATVWLRYQISETANRIKVTEQKIAKCERNLAETVTDIETEQSPDVLRRRNEELKLGLAFPNEMQVMRIPDDVEARLAAKSRSSVVTDGGLLVVFKPSNGDAR